MVTAIVTKIHTPKMSRYGNTVYTRIEFILEDNDWAKTDVCHSFRNYPRWVPVLESGVGTRLSNLILRKKGEINTDSYPKILGKQPLAKPAAKVNQGKLF